MRTIFTIMNRCPARSNVLHDPISQYRKRSRKTIQQCPPSSLTRFHLRLQGASAILLGFCERLWVRPRVYPSAGEDAVKAILRYLCFLRRLPVVARASHLGVREFTIIFLGSFQVPGEKPYCRQGVRSVSASSSDIRGGVRQDRGQ